MAEEWLAEEWLDMIRNGRPQRVVAGGQMNALLPAVSFRCGLCCDCLLNESLISTASYGPGRHVLVMNPGFHRDKLGGRTAPAGAVLQSDRGRLPYTFDAQLNWASILGISS